MEKQVMLEKLKNLEYLIDENLRLKRYVENDCSAEALSEMMAVKKEIGSIPTAPAVVNCKVSFPPDETALSNAKENTEKRKQYLMIAAGVTVLLLVIYFITIVQFFNTLSVIGIFGTAAMGWSYKTSKDELKKHQKNYDEAMSQHSESLTSFRKALTSYEKDISVAMEQLVRYELGYYQKYPKYKEIVFGYEEKLKTAEKELDENYEKLGQIDFIPLEYFHLVSRIISMLESGRADSYKEALNMAIDEERQDAMEAERRQEEARRLEALERQAEEERRHNMMMERQQADHERAMERAAREQAEETRMMGVRKCWNCANYGKCSSKIIGSGAGLNCGGYRPK